MHLAAPLLATRLLRLSQNFLVRKHDQTCYLHFSYLTLARGVVVNPCSLQNLAESRGVEPHPISENPVFKAGRRTIPAALLSIIGTPGRIRTDILYSSV